MSRKQNLLPKTCVGHARLLKTTATTTTTHAHAVTTHNHSVHLGDGQNSLLPGLKTPALVENFCSKLNRPATNQILLRTAKTSRDCRKLRKTAWYQRIFVSHQLSSSDAHIFTLSSFNFQCIFEAGQGSGARGRILQVYRTQEARLEIDLGVCLSH